MAGIMKRNKSEERQTSQKMLVQSLSRGRKSKNLKQLKQKSIAVSSGKGGVGKTIIAANLSIYCAKKGLRVGLIDLDPLSDITTVLDLYESESAIIEEGFQKGRNNFSDHILNLFPNLDLVFPAPKLARNESAGLLNKIYRQFAGDLNDKYDILIFDMPAGNNYEDNLAFLPFMNTLILVTNAEPTAHVSAGSYIKHVLDLYADMNINVWHNRYPGKLGFGFNPKDIAGNYNKNVPEDDWLKEENFSQIRDSAFIPEDPSLNLLRGEPEIIVEAQRSILDILELIQDEKIAEKAEKLNVSANVLDLIKFFISRNRNIDDIDDYLNSLGEYLNKLLINLETKIADAGVEMFTPEERLRLTSFLKGVKEDSLRETALKLISLVEESIEKSEKSRSIFSADSNAGHDRAIDRETGSLLIELSRISDSNSSIKNFGGLLLFYFSIYKLFQSKTIIKIISNFIPKKRDTRGNLVRDRHRQIKNLVERDKEYQRKYFTLVKILYRIINRQISTIVRTFGLSNLLFRDENNQVIKSAYLKLLTNFIHDTIYSGLSIIVDFEYRAAAVAFQDGAEKILESMPTGNL